MEAIAFEQAMDRMCEDGYLNTEIHVQPVEIIDERNGQIIGYTGERVKNSKAVANKTLKKIYTVAKDRELMLLSNNGNIEVIEEGEKIELVATEHNMNNTCFFILRPQSRRRSSLRRIALQFKGYNKVLSRDFSA